MPRISSGSSSDDDTETDSDAEQSEDGENSKNGKKCAKFRLNLTEEEIKYRKKNFNSIEELLSKQVRCTCCAKELRIRIVNGSEVLSHPVLDVLLCKDCYKFYGNGDFSVDEDGTDKYCRWCGQGGTLYCCAECTCAFCKACIKRNLKRSILKDIESEDWKCFICYGKPLWDLRAICWAAKKYSAQMRKEQRLKNQKALEKLKEKRLNNTPKRKTTRSRDSLRTETNEPEIIAIDSGSDDSGTTPKKLMNSSDSRKRKLFHEDDTNSNSEGEEICEAVNHENKEKCDKSLKIPDRLDSEQSIKVEREGTSSEEEKGVPQESFALTRENTRQICRLLAEQLKDFITTGEIISDQASKILKKKVNKKHFKELLDVDKTVEKIQLLAELSVKNLEKAKINTRTFYKQWRKDLATKKRKNHAQDNTKKLHVNADCHVLVDKPPACVDATGKVIPTSETTDLEMEVDCLKQVHSDRESSDREQCSPLKPNMLQATSTPYKEDEKKSEKDQNNSVVHNASSQSDETVLKAVSNSSLQSNDSMKSPQKSDTVREEDKHEDKSASSLKNEVRNLCEENSSETAVVISEMSTVILDEETDKHCHRKGNVDNCVNSDASTELLDLVASTKNHENDTLDSCQRDLDDAESQTTDKTDVCENDTIMFEYQEPLSSELIDTMESILAKVDGNISCPDIFANTEGKLPSSPCDPTEGKLQLSSPCDPTEEKLQSSPCDATEGKLQPSPCDATEGKLQSSPCDATEKKLQSSPCDATEGKLQPSPCDATEGKLQPSPCDATEGKLQSSPCDTTEGELQTSLCVTTEGKLQNSPCDPAERKIQSSPCDHSEGKIQSSPCDPTEGKPQSSPICDPHEDSLESDKENKYSTDALKTKEKLLEVSSEDNSDSDGSSCSDDETQRKKRKKHRRLSSRKQPGNLKVLADKNSLKKKKSGLRGLPSCSDSDSESSVDSVRISKYKQEKFKLDCLAQFNDEKLRNGCYVKLQRLTNFSNGANKCDVDNVSDKEKRIKSKNIISESDAESMDDDEEQREIRRLLSLRALKKKPLKLNAELNDADSDSSKASSTTRKEKKAKKEKKNDEEVESLLSVHKKVVDGDMSPDSDTDGDGTCPISEKQSEKPRKQDDEDSLNHDKIAKLLLLHESSDSESSDSLHLEGQSNKSVVKKKKDVEENTIKKSEESVEEQQEESSLKEKIKEKNSLEPVENDEHQEEEKEILRGDEERKGSENDDDSCGGEHMASVKSETKSESEEMPDNTEPEAEVKNQSKEGGEEEEEKVNKSAECKESKDKDKKSAEETEEDKPKKTWRSNKLLRTKLSETDSSEEERKWNAKKQKKEAEDSSDSPSGATSKIKRKKKRRRIVDSDSCSDIKSGSESSDLEALFDTKRKRKRKSESSDIDSKSSSSSSSMEVKKKPKRRRVVVPTSNSSGSDSEDLNSTQKSEGTPGKGRKNIRRVLKDENVAEATKRAAREEEERKKRIAEKQKMYNALFLTGEANVEKLDKLVLDFDQETKQELITVHKDIVGKLKPHQVKGVKFMWDTCFESIQQLKESKGTGCILAHCMGLGKTLQVVTLVHTVLSHPDTCVKTVLVICPYSTIKNWVNEFHIWLKDLSDSNEIEVFELTRYKKNYERMYQLKQWHEEGGVMVMGYEMYRNLAGNAKLKARKQMIENFQTILVDPGPDLIVCDEGHLLKNENSAISKALRKIRTLRRIVLTGTPLQNNLSEYHCMVQFVKPNLLGSKKEFDNRFVNPIRNGQYVDSTLHDVKVMKRRAHVLHKMLESSVQRFDYGVLTPFLPPKHEYVISVRLSEAQVKLYRYYLDNFSAASELNEPTRGKGAKLFADFQALQRIWTHPRVIRMDADRKEKDEERKQMMASDSEGSLKDFVVNDTTSDSSDDSSKESGAEEADKKKSSSDDDVIEITEKENEEEDQKSSRWWEQFVTEEDMEDIKCSGKLMLLFYILQECEKIGDKVLVFSQSLLSLDLIEYFLGKIDESTQQSSESKGSQLKFTGSWSPGLDYFRLDGSTSAENRNIWCKNFNKESNFRARLFLISTRAGGLGINLVAANRVVLFDASWNPSHDVQSIFRIYRFGQKKPCYVYRLLAQGTMEEKIYDRQVTKLSLSCRVVDEQQIERHYNMADLQEMYMFDPEQVSKRPTPVLPKDRLLAELLKEHEYWVITYHEHDSLLQNKEEEELNEEERKAAWEEYENEKKPKIPAPTFAFMNQNMGMHQGSMGPLQIPTNMLREMLKRENPQATEPQLTDRLNTVITNISTLIANNQLIGGTEYEGYLNLLRQQYMQEQLRKESQLAANERYMNASNPVQPQYSNYYVNQGVKPAQLTFVRKEVIGAPSTSKTNPMPKIKSYGQVRAIGPKKVYAAPIKSYGANIHGLQKENTVNTVSSMPQQQTPSDDSIEIID